MSAGFQNDEFESSGKSTKSSIAFEELKEGMLPGESWVV
jgi:hypothetical protein